MLRVLRLYLKAAIFKPELPRTRGESNPRRRDCESRRANHETTSKGRFASKNIARRHSESAWTRTISAEGSPRLRQIRTAPQRERFDAHDLRRWSRAHRRNRKKVLNFLTSTTRISAEGCARTAEIVKSPQFLNLDHANLRRGSRAHAKNRKKSSVFEPRPRKSPQRVARGQQKS